jgi:hypothetical protein
LGAILSSVLYTRYPPTYLDTVPRIRAYSYFLGLPLSVAPHHRCFFHWRIQAKKQHERTRGHETPCYAPCRSHMQGCVDCCAKHCVCIGTDTGTGTAINYQDMDNAEMCAESRVTHALLCHSTCVKIVPSFLLRPYSPLPSILSQVRQSEPGLRACMHGCAIRREAFVISFVASFSILASRILYRSQDSAWASAVMSLPLTPPQWFVIFDENGTLFCWYR